MKTYSISTFKVRLRVHEEEAPPRSVTASVDAVALLRAIFDDLDADQEHFVVLTLNVKNQVEGYKVLSSGGMNLSYVDMKLLFRAALALGGAAIIVSHNHQSGDPSPSIDDKNLTQEIAKAAKLLNFTMLDHIIIGSRGYYSFAEEGMLP